MLLQNSYQVHLSSKVHNTQLNKQVSLYGHRHMKNGIFLLLGTNQGDRGKNLTAAKQRIEEHAGRTVRFSSAYKTAAWGNHEQPEFYNQVIEIQTTLSPHQLLAGVLAIELEMGRKRLEKWGPRIIDIDILFFNQQVIDTATLTLPHPRIPDRRFTLVPLAEIAPGFYHPVLQKNVTTLLEECQDDLPVVRVDNLTL
jgi:2-amino-4-hydroxy-6-hydroxymethyldihydropteridine diphosphokinase